MRSETHSGLPSPELLRRRSGDGSSAWKRWGAMVGIVGGPVSGVAGVCLLLVSYAVVAARTASIVAAAGNLLVFLVIPLLMLGAHCLDCLEEDRAAKPTRDTPSFHLVLNAWNSHDRERTRGYTR